MRGRKPESFVLNKKDKTALHQLLCHGHTPFRVARRAQVLMARARGQRVEHIALQVAQNASTVWRVCERYDQHGLHAALYDAPRSGRPRVFSPTRAEAD